MPRFDVVERHATVVRAAPAAVYAAIKEADLRGGGVTRTLLGLRALPAFLPALFRAPRAAFAEWREHRAGRAVRLADFERAGFRIVAERPPEELVIGLLGRFWTPRGALCAEIDAESFRSGPPSGQALAGWNFTVVPASDGLCELRTETRVWCAPDAKRRFMAYWMIIRPGSGLIRRGMLQAIRRQAEQGARP